MHFLLEWSGGGWLSRRLRGRSREAPPYPDYGSVSPAPPLSATRHPRYWSRSEISGGSRRAIRGESGAASRPTRYFHKEETAARRSKRGVDLSLQFPLRRGVCKAGTPESLVHTRKGDVRCYCSSFCWWCCLAAAAAITGIPAGGAGGGLGIVGTVLLVVVVLYLFGGMHYPG